MMKVTTNTRMFLRLRVQNLLATVLGVSALLSIVDAQRQFQVVAEPETLRSPMSDTCRFALPLEGLERAQREERRGNG